MPRKGGVPANLRPAQKGEVRNPYGARKTVGKINAELEAKGYTEASAKDITSCYMRLINVTKHQLTEMVADETQPVLVQVVGKAILSNRGFDIIDKMMDRSIGKSVQPIDATGEVQHNVTFKIIE